MSTATPPADAASPSAGLAGGFGQLFLAPREGFERLLAFPRRWWVPLLGIVALNVAFTFVWMRNVDPQEFMREQLSQSPRAADMAPEQMERVVEAQARMFPFFAWSGPVLFVPLTLLVVAGAYLLVFRFIMGGEVRFVPALAVVAWSFLAVGLVTTPMLLATLWGKGDWNTDPRTAVQANPSLFLDKAETPPFLYSVADSLDLFSFWLLGLLAVGFAVAARRRTGWAAGGVLGLWLVYVLGRATLAAVF